MSNPARSLLLSILLIPASADAQVTPQGGSFQTTASANAPGCSDNDGGLGISPAAAACVDGQGYAASAGSSAGFAQDAQGGSATVSAEASATVIGSAAHQQSTGNASGIVGMSWLVGSDVHYSLSSDVSGGGFAQLSDNMGILPPSGVLAAGNSYGFNAGASAFANAKDVNGAETVIATPSDATAVVTFAVVGSLTLVMGTATAGGGGMAGLLVEALDGSQVVVATTLTGDDGSYLLPSIGTTVTLRISDPGARFATAVSPPLSAPATFDTDLAPIPNVPALSGAWELVLVVALLAARRPLRASGRAGARAS
jgi:hypothetical protein